MSYLSADELKAIVDKVLSKGIQDVIDERLRQVDEEGWTAEHDQQYELGTLAAAGATYAFFAGLHHPSIPRSMWPSDTETENWSKWWKQKDRRRDLVRAAALIIAEIDLLDSRTPPNA